MNTQNIQKEVHRIELVKAMITMVVRYPDGVSEIASAFTEVLQAGHEIADIIGDSEGEPHLKLVR